MAPLAARRLMPFVLVILLLLSARCAPHLVSRNLRGDDGSGKLYIYPPGSRPWRAVRATESFPDACAGLPASGRFFDLRQRRTLRGSTLVLRDRGRLPASKADFDADVDQVLDTAQCLRNRPERERLKASLWARMPRTFEDDLLSRYGFHAGKRWVDLHAGMRLRVEWAARIADLATPEENSFVGTGTTWWTIGTRPDGALAFEPAFGWSNAGPFTRQRNDVIAGSVDLDARGLARKFYRLLYPLEGFGNTRPPNDHPINHPVLIGADDRGVLDDLSEAYDARGECNRGPNPGRGLCTPFAGRAVPIPEIEIELRGERMWVSLGTTLRQILEREGRAFRGSTRNLHLLRVHGSEWRNVVVDDTGVLTAPDLLDLPLVKGDRLEW